VYQKITGKSCFKDYDVLCESYEQKIMLQIYLQSIIYLEKEVKMKSRILNRNVCRPVLELVDERLKKNQPVELTEK
jgi:hypothetical protein